MALYVQYNIRWMMVFQVETRLGLFNVFYFAHRHQHLSFSIAFVALGLFLCKPTVGRWDYFCLLNVSLSLSHSSLLRSPIILQKR